MKLTVQFIGFSFLFSAVWILRIFFCDLTCSSAVGLWLCYYATLIIGTRLRNDVLCPSVRPSVPFRPIRLECKVVETSTLVWTFYLTPATDTPFSAERSKVKVTRSRRILESAMLYYAQEVCYEDVDNGFNSVTNYCICPSSNATSAHVWIFESV